MPPKLTTKDTAVKKKQKLLSKAKAVLKVDPEAVKRRLDEASNQLRLDVHHEVLKQTQDEVEDHFEFITNLQALNQALRERDHKRDRAQDSVMNMFATKCLSTVHAWLLSEFFFRLIERLLLAADASLSENQNALSLFGYLIYAVLLAIVIPPLQFRLSRVDAGEKYTRKHAFVDLQAKAMPMIMAWAFKDVVQYLLKVTDPDNTYLWNEIVITLILVMVVAFLQHLPAVSRAGAELGGANPSNTIKNRYLTLPSAMYLGTGYAFNQLATFVVDVLSRYADDSGASESTTGQNAATIFKVMFQTTYFGIMALAVIRFDAWFQNRKESREKRQEDLEEDEDYVAAFELEVANDVCDTVTHATAFVYGWGFSDTLRVIYFPFFNGCPSSSWSSCTETPQYPLVWYYAILTSLILGAYMKQLSMQEYRSAHSKSYRTLMITAMSLTVGWGWMDVCNSTTTFFIDEWMKKHESQWSIPIIYAVLLVFVYMILTEVYYQILDEMRYLKRERFEFQENFPTIPASARAASHHDLEQVLSETAADTTTATADTPAAETKDVHL